jgi:PfaB family protein
VWQAGDQAMRVLDESPVFKTRLAGPRQAVLEYWNSNGNYHASWENHILMAPPEKVIPVLAQVSRVYMTHINAPNQVVIGGDAAGCSQVIKTMGCPSLRAPFDHVLHCPPVKSEYHELRMMNDWPVRITQDVKLLTADGYTQLPGTSQGVADCIARMLINPLDFPRLVRQAYDAGARFFIEVGAGSNCTRWVDESLAGKPHLAVPANRRGISDRSTLLRLAARLASHHIPVNIRSLTPAS